MELEYKVLKDILTEQKKTNEYLQQLIMIQTPKAVSNTMQKPERKART